MSSKRKRPPRQAALRKARRGNNSRSKYNRGPGQHKASRLKAGPIIRHPPHGIPDQQWFEAHPDRQYRIRPKQHDGPDTGYLILKQVYPGIRSRLDIGPVGALLTDTDEVLGKVYDSILGGMRGVFFRHNGTIVGGDELES